MAQGLQEKGGESYGFSHHSPMAQGVCNRKGRQNQCGLCAFLTIQRQEKKKPFWLGRDPLLENLQEVASVKITYSPYA